MPKIQSIVPFLIENDVYFCNSKELHRLTNQKKKLFCISKQYFGKFLPINKNKTIESVLAGSKLH